MVTPKPRKLRVRGRDFAECVGPDAPFLRRVLIKWNSLSVLSPDECQRISSWFDHAAAWCREKRKEQTDGE